MKTLISTILALFIIAISANVYAGEEVSAGPGFEGPHWAVEDASEQFIQLITDKYASDRHASSTTIVMSSLVESGLNLAAGGLECSSQNGAKDCKCPAGTFCWSTWDDCGCSYPTEARPAE